MLGPSSKGNSFSLPSPDPAVRDLCPARLVGKLLHVRKFNFKAIVSVLAAAWKLGDRVSFSPLEHGALVCSFVCEVEVDKILQLGPWNFRGSLIVFKRWESDCVLADIDFDTFNIWVHAYNLPPCHYTAVGAKFIGNFVGTFQEVDLGSKYRKSAARFLRFRVTIFVSQPLVTGFFLERVGKTRVWIQFRFERLVDFCYRCGALSHVEAQCSIPLASLFGPLDPGEAFGPWLRSDFTGIGVIHPPTRASPPSLVIDKANIPPPSPYPEPCIYSSPVQPPLPIIVVPPPSQLATPQSTPPSFTLPSFIPLDSLIPPSPGTSTFISPLLPSLPHSPPPSPFDLPSSPVDSSPPSPDRDFPCTSQVSGLCHAPFPNSLKCSADVVVYVAKRARGDPHLADVSRTFFHMNLSPPLSTLPSTVPYSVEESLSPPLTADSPVPSPTLPHPIPRRVIHIKRLARSPGVLSPRPGSTSNTPFLPVSTLSFNSVAEEAGLNLPPTPQ